MAPHQLSGALLCALPSPHPSLAPSTCTEQQTPQAVKRFTPSPRRAAVAREGGGFLTRSHRGARWLQGRQAEAPSSGAPALAAVGLRAGMICRRDSGREGQDPVRSLCSQLCSLVLWGVPVQKS